MIMTFLLKWTENVLSQSIRVYIHICMIKQLSSSWYVLCNIQLVERGCRKNTVFCRRHVLRFRPFRDDTRRIHDDDDKMCRQLLMGFFDCFYLVFHFLFDPTKADIKLNTHYYYYYYYGHHINLSFNNIYALLYITYYMLFRTAVVSFFFFLTTCNFSLKPVV